MAWKKVPPELVAFLEKALVPFESERRTMFGCPVYFVRDNMFVGAYEDAVMLRLPEQDQSELFAAHPQAMGKVLGIVYRAIAHLRHKAGLKRKEWRHWRGDADTALRLCSEPQYRLPHPVSGWRVRLSR